MKDFDIDKLERKNIYKTPENFFAEVQANVLQQAIPQKKARMRSLNWAYGAAAAVALLVSTTFLVYQGDEQTEVIAQSSPVVVPTPVTAPVETKNEAKLAYETFANDLTSVSIDNQKAEAAPIQTVAKAKKERIEKPKLSTPSPEVQVDQILANITSAELATLGRNVEQDVYLDLYY